MDPKTHSFQVHLAFKVLMILSSAIHINYHILPEKIGYNMVSLFSLTDLRGYYIIIMRMC